MGLNCSKSAEDNLRTLNNNIQRVVPNETVHVTTPLNLIEILGRKNIDESFAKIVVDLENKEDKNKGEKVLDQELPSLKNLFRLWISEGKQEGGDGLLTYRVEMNVPFSPELIQMFLLNLTEPVFKDYYLNSTGFSIVDSTIDKDTIVYLVKSKEAEGEKFLARVVRRLENNDMLEYSKSVKLTTLNEQPEIKKLVDQVQNEKVILKSGRDTAIVDEGTRYVWFGKFNKPTEEDQEKKEEKQKKLLKWVIEKHDGFLLRMAEFALETKETDDLLWFTDDKEDIKRVLEENRTYIKKSGIDVKELSKKQFERKTQDVLLSKVPDLQENVKNVLVSGVDKMENFIQNKFSNKEESENKQTEEKENLTEFC